MPIAPLLQQFVDEELARTADLIERVRMGTIDHLRQPGAAGPQALERQDSYELGELLRAQRDRYNAIFETSLRASVLADLQEQTTGTPMPLGDPSGTLTLMDETRIESDIEISRVVQRIEDRAEWELRELQTFISTLCGHVHVMAEGNPLRPLLYARALWDAAGALTSVPKLRSGLLRASAGPLAEQLKLAWAAAATRLEGQGIQPGIYRTVVLAPGTVIERSSMPPPTPAVRTEPPPARSGMFGGPALPDMMTTRLAPAGSPPAAVPPSPPAAPAPPIENWLHLSDEVSEVSGSLGVRVEPPPPLQQDLEEGLLHFEDQLRSMPVPDAHARRNSNTPTLRLRDQQAQLNAVTVDVVDRQVIDLLSRLFDNVLSDVQLHPGLRALVARLQASALRVALNDGTMMEDRQHPVWALMDLISTASAPYTQAGDPRLEALLRCCETLVSELTQGSVQDGPRYRRACAQLTDWLEQQRQQQVEAAEPQIEPLTRLERRNTLQQHLSARLRDQIGSLPLSDSLRRFLTDTWAQVLADSIQRHGEQGDVTVRQIKAVDDLLWSVNLPDHPQSRKRLLSLLPALLQQLRQGMAAVHMAPAAQEAVMAELMALHTDALRPGARDTAGGAKPESAEQIVQQMRDEVLPDLDEGNGFADSLIDIASMETVPADLIEEPPVDMLTDAPHQRAQWVADLPLGARYRIFLRGRWMRVQLIWRSAMGSLLLFAGETPDRTHSITERALQRLLDERLLLPMEDKTLVQRAIDAVYRELS